MRIFICFALLIISSYANELEEAIEHNNTRVSLYLHPASLFSNLIDITAIYSTVEIPFSLSNSLIVKPSLFNNYTEFRLGSDIGFRNYQTGNGEGLYLQGQIGVFYYKRNVDNRGCGCDLYDTSCECGIEVINPSDYCFPVRFYGKSLWLDVMGYIGNSWKFSQVSVFLDVGFGGVLGIRTKAKYIYLSGLPDLNIGVGVPF
ncbi:MAG: hypothetical protein FWF63_06100 [Fibromonadales bacterium]|nr:hypothetical protein [Fibromonadales bacterium]